MKFSRVVSVACFEVRTAVAVDTTLRLPRRSCAASCHSRRARSCSSSRKDCKANSRSRIWLLASICCSSKYCVTLALMASPHCCAQRRRASAIEATSGVGVPAA
jgi:hypothetical protein